MSYIFYDGNDNARICLHSRLIGDYAGQKGEIYNAVEFLDDVSSIQTVAGRENEPGFRAEAYNSSGVRIAYTIAAFRTRYAAIAAMSDAMSCAHFALYSGRV